MLKCPAASQTAGGDPARVIFFFLNLVVYGQVHTKVMIFSLTSVYQFNLINI